MDQKVLNEDDQLMEEKQKEQQILKEKQLEEEQKNPPKPGPSHWKIFLFEFFGTLIFAHGIIASQTSDLLVALSLFAGIFFSASFSSGHLNPAVSLAFYTTGDMKFVTLMVYMGAQLLGAFCGGITGWLVLDDVNCPWIPKQDMNWIAADLFGEMLGTFTFVLIIRIMTEPKTSYHNDSVLIMLTIATGLFFSRQLTVHSGGALNPGVAIGLELWAGVIENKWKYMRRCYVYIFGPFIGAVFAALVYKNLWCPTFEEKKKEKAVEQDKNQQELVNGEENNQ